jgi:ribonucrease Y
MNYCIKKRIFMAFFNNLSSLFSRARDKKPSTGKDKKPTTQAQQPSVKTAPAKTEDKTQGKFSTTSKQQPQQAQPKSQPQQSQPQKQTVSTVATDQEIKSMLREAQAQAREIIVEAKDKALQTKAEVEQEARKQEQEFTKRQRDLDSKIDKLDRHLDEIQQKESRVDKERETVEKLKAKLDETKAKMLSRLEEISGMTAKEAQNVLMEGLEKQLTQEMSQMIRQKQEETQLEAKEITKEILIDSMRHGATDFVAEYTVSILDIPSEDVKGKIIGKSGRNIHAFERLTGVDLDLDYSETEVRLSCFDPVRREIARIALEKLIKDGRIQPARIEQVVAKVKEEIEESMVEAGKELCQMVGVYNLPAGLVKTLGRFKYRFSYGQNMIKHTLEETKIGIKLAHELGVDVNIVKLGCLLHDIGKVSETPDGSHVEIGVKIAKKYNMPQEVIDCIAQHHEDTPFTSQEAMTVYIADAISGARPGARYENIEEYVERLEELEQIATSYSEVEEAYAVKAGREVRVLLNPKQSKDDDVVVLANKIRDKIKDKVTFPGTITVNVIRETRGEAIAS